MNLFSIRTVAVVASTFLLVGLPAVAMDPVAEEPTTYAERLAEARDTLDAATARWEAARAAYTEARHERHPRGDALGAIEQEFADAKQELERARRELDALIDDARPAGVPPGVVRPYL